MSGKQRKQQKTVRKNGWKNKENSKNCEKKWAEKQRKQQKTVRKNGRKNKENSKKL